MFVSEANSRWFGDMHDLQVTDSPTRARLGHHSESRFESVCRSGSRIVPIMTRTDSAILVPHGRHSMAPLGSSTFRVFQLDR
jgi:hypothetical protein